MISELEIVFLYNSYLKTTIIKKLFYTLPCYFSLFKMKNIKNIDR